MRTCLLALWAASNCALAAAPIQLMVEDAAAPWSGPDGKGYANDIVRAAYAAVGQAVELQVVPYIRCKVSVTRGLTSGCFSMSPEPELRGKVNLADQPLFTVRPRFYTKAGRAQVATSEQRIPAGSRVGIVSGYEYNEALRNMEKRGVIFDPVNSEQSNLRKLAAGRIDYAIVMLDPMKTGERMLHDAGVVDIKVAFDSAPMGSYLGFSAQHPDGERARKLFNEGYRIIQHNGSKAAIAKRWAVREGSSP